MKTIMTLFLSLFSLNIFASYSAMYGQDNYESILRETSAIVESQLNFNLGRVKTSYSSSSGTSAYLKYKLFDQDQVISRGALLPRAEATDVLGEIVSYKLAQILGFGGIYAAKTLIKIEGEGLKPFYSGMIKLQNELIGKRGFGLKKKNVKSVLGLIEKENVLWIAFAPWGERPYEFQALAKENHPLRKAITVRGVHPSSLTESIIRKKSSQYGTRIRGGEINPLRLAKELSNHMIVDILTGQYDRWSGGNIQYFVDSSNQIHIGAFDNGGTFEWTQSRYKKYFKIVSRFDKETVVRLRALQSFLNKRSSQFLDYKNINDLLSDLELVAPKGLSLNQVRSPKSILRRIKSALDKLIDHINSTCHKRGSRQCYF